MDDIVSRIEARGEELARLVKEGGNDTLGRRAAILLGLRGGQSQRTAARQMGCSRWTVQETVRRFLRGGMEALRDGRQGRCLPEKCKEIIELLPILVAVQPGEYGWLRSTWRVELVVLEVECQTQVKVSRAHMGRLLRASGCRRVKPRPSIALAPAD